MPIGKARLKAFVFVAARAGYPCCLALFVLLFASRALQNAVAEGDTRTITMHHIHTDEDITITFKRDGQYDEAALEKLNWFLRDWRKSQETKMDPHLIDLVWEVQRESGSKEPIWVVCGYRSPETNAMLRHRSSGVARFSQHMLGHAMDYYIPGVPLAQLRAIGLRLARGGVGFYPTSGSPFVHMDTGSIRMWPRMTHDELARVFPDGKTVQIPTDGKPLPGYALALAEIKQRGNAPSDNSIDAARSSGVDVGMVASNTHFRNPFAKLLGLKTDEDDDADGAASDTTASVTPEPGRVAAAKAKVVAAIEHTAQKTAAATTRLAKAAETKLVHTASLIHVTHAEAAPNPPPPPAEANAARYAALSPNQIITSRGYWQGSPDGAAQSLAQSALKNALHSPGLVVASADPNTTGSISALPGATPDHVAGGPRTRLCRTAQPHLAVCSRCDRGGGGTDSGGRTRPAHRAKWHDDRGKGRHRPAAVLVPARYPARFGGGQSWRALRRSMAARRRSFAEREPFPDHAGVRRTRLHFAGGTDGETRKLGDDDVLHRPFDGTVQRSLQRQRNRIPVDHYLSDAHRFAAVRPAAPTSYAVIGRMQGPPTESASTYHHGVVFVAIK